jgi:hypothetical protein
LRPDYRNDTKVEREVDYSYLISIKTAALEYSISPVATAAVSSAIPMQNGLSHERFWICLAVRTIASTSV